MIVGATDATDADILRQSSGLYQSHKLKRVYYSAFSPIPHGDTRLPIQSPPLLREHRLYQSDWLLRFYGFQVDEIVPADAPELALDKDPKLSWALRHRAYFPVDVNKASLRRLLRVPGLGVRTAKRILTIRRHHALTLDDLQRLRVPMNKVRPWVLTADWNPETLLLDSDRLELKVLAATPQLELFSAAASTLSGEL